MAGGEQEAGGGTDAGVRDAASDGVDEVVEPLPAPASLADPPRAAPVRSRPGPQPKAGPPDVAIDVVLAARSGDPGAFAQLVEHWDPYLRPFVGCCLAGDGSTDRVLSATYVRAYRALPRYRADRTPGLWLHRVAYLAVLDELRRLSRDPLRRKDAPTTRDAVMVATPGADDDAVIEPRDVDAAVGPVLEPRTVAPRPAGAPDQDLVLAPDTAALDHVAPGGGGDPGAGAPSGRVGPGAATTTRALRRLASDQRAMVFMVDRERFSVDQVADVFDTTAPIVRSRLNLARRILLGGQASDLPPDTSDEELEADHAAQAAAVSRVLGDLPPPATSPTFWSELGNRLLAERTRPAAPPPDPMARLNPPHPAEPGFQPTDAGRRTVTEIGALADRTRPGRPWGRYLLVGFGVVALIAAVVAMVRFGISERTPDGTISAAKLESMVRPPLAVNNPVRFRAEVETPEQGDEPAQYTVLLGDQGSWSVSEEGTLDLQTYDGSSGVSTHLDLDDSSRVRARLDTGLAAGAPDAGPVAPGPVADLAAVGALLRSDPDARVSPTREGDTRTWTYTTRTSVGSGGPEEEWTVVARRSDGVVLRVELRRDGQLVRRTNYAGWTPNAVVPDGTFLPPVPDGVPPELTNAGFVTGDLQSAEDLGRGAAVTPNWLPDGFTLATVTLRQEPAPGQPSTGGGRNPEDRNVLSLGYRRGPERITVTLRDSGGDPTAWHDPFQEKDGELDQEGRTLGDGPFNGSEVTIDTDAAGRASLWGLGRDTLFTVSGDVSADEAFRIASSLR